MRRIIERKVTVVTTTTWTISWQDDLPQASSEAEPVHSTESHTDTLPVTQMTSPFIETNDAGITKAKSAEPANLSKPSSLERK